MQQKGKGKFNEDIFMVQYSNVSRAITVLLLLFIPFISWGQIKVISEEVENQELLDFFRFEKIQYEKLSFTSKELKGKTFRLSAKEIWDGEIKKDSTVVASRTTLPSGYEILITINDTIFTMRAISKLTEDCKLRMQFSIPSATCTSSFNAICSNEYSLRKAIEKETVEFGEKFYALVYMLPYEKDNIKHYCAVEASGKDIEIWGKEFGIKHYLVFEMIFE